MSGQDDFFRDVGDADTPKPNRSRHAQRPSDDDESLQIGEDHAPVDAAAAMEHRDEADRTPSTEFGPPAAVSAAGGGVGDDAPRPRHAPSRPASHPRAGRPPRALALPLLAVGLLATAVLLTTRPFASSDAADRAMARASSLLRAERAASSRLATELKATSTALTRTRDQLSRARRSTRVERQRAARWKRAYTRLTRRRQAAARARGRAARRTTARPASAAAAPRPRVAAPPRPPTPRPAPSGCGEFDLC